MNRRSFVGSFLSALAALALPWKGKGRCCEVCATGMLRGREVFILGDERG
jgi:hypothetical protein